MMERRLLRLVTTPQIRDQQGLFRYVTLATTASVAAALLLDIVNQLVFFLDWQTALRSWIVTIGVALVIAIPILSWVGRAHLALFRSKQVVELLSRTDPLTGLPNRRAVLEAAEQRDVTLMVLVILDVDHFKKVNDTYGHRVGDAVLQAVSQIMAASLHGLGLLGRIGGEEFALVSSGVAPQAVLERLDALRGQIAAQPVMAAGQAVPVTISAGMAVRHQQTLDELYAEADRALYVAKRAGRNRIGLPEELRDLREAAAPSRPAA